MAFNKIDVTNEWQEVLPTEDVAIWCPKLANINFATGETSPETTGVYDLLLAGLKNKLFIKAGASLWVRTQNESGSTLFYAPELINGTSGGDSTSNDGEYEFTIDGENTFDANDVQVFYQRYTKTGHTVLPVLTIHFVPTSANPQIAFNANFTTETFGGENEAGGTATVELTDSPTGADGSGKISSIPGTSSIKLSLATPDFDSIKGYEVAVNCSYIPPFIPDVPPFTAVWDTTASGFEPENATIALPLVELGEYNFYIDWGDGNTDHITSFDQTEVSHTYSEPGTYTTQIRGTIVGWNFRENYTTPECLADITQWGCLQWDNDNYTGGYFYDTWSMNAITASDVPDLTGVTSLNEAFFGSAVATINNIGLWDTSNITDTSYCFQYAWQFNDPNINNWNVINVTTMEGMFDSAEVFNQPLNLWQTLSLINSSFMFNNCVSFNQSLNNFFMDNNETTESMFAGCPEFNGDVWMWTFSSCLNMSKMFQGCTSFDKDFVTTGYWNTPQVSDFTEFMLGCTSFNQPLDLLDVSSAVYLDNMLSGCLLFNQPLPSWSTGNCQSFYGTLSTTSFNQALTFDMSSATSIAYLLTNAPFNQDVSGLDVSSCQDFSYAFYNTPINQSFAAWDVSSALNMTGMLGLTTLSTTNYNATLISWASQVVNPGVPFDAGNAQYNGAAIVAHDTLTGAPNNWIITDGGIVPTFRTTWDTELTTIGNKTIVLPLVSTGVYDFYVDWGDGNTDIITAWDQAEATHVYATVGAYIVNISGTIVGWSFRDNPTSAGDIALLQRWGDLILDNGTIDGGYFYNTNWINITATDVPNLTGVTSFNQAFYGSAIFHIVNLSVWDVSAITDMSECFKNCPSFDGVGLGGWDISNVTNLNSFLNNVTLSNANYNALLTGWAAQTVNAGITFDGGNSHYDGAGVAAHNTLTGTPNNWTITDGGTP